MIFRREHGIYKMSIFAKSRALAATLLAACSLLLIAPAQADIRFTDVLGREVKLDKPAERVLLGFYFEDYIAIVGPKAIDRLTAVSLHYWKGYRPRQYDAYLAAFPRIAELTDVGDVDNATMSLEKIVAAKPDVAILSSSQVQYLGAAVQQIEAFGIPVVAVDYNAQTVEKHVASTRIIGKVMGTEERAERLAANYQKNIDDTLARIRSAGAAGSRKAYVELGQKGPAEYGNTYGKGMWAGVLDLVGAKNIAEGQVASWGPLSAEYVLGARPDVIFVTGSEWMSLPNAVVMGFGVDPALTRQRLQPYLNRAGWSELPAVKSSEVYAIYHGGTRTLYDYVFARYMAKALYPKAFADIDPPAELNAYYAENLPIKPAGDFMLRLDQRQ
jgi:ABC-type Fe3+-hydroxamate transport system substrate-binding protein